MRAALFGTYNRFHSANRIAAIAARAAGFELVEYHEPLWEETRDKDAAYFSIRSLAVLAGRWLAAAWRLARAWRRTGGAPVAIVGFNGQLDVLLLRVLGFRHGPRIVFAPLVSLTETLVEDRRVYEEGSWAARALEALDRLTCRAADVVVVDTEQHRRWFVRELGVDPSRLLVCHLGADPEVFLEVHDSTRAPRDGRERARPHREDATGEARPLEVLWFGQYLPLHGLDVVVDAVGRLAARDGFAGRYVFTFIGTGPQRARIEAGLRATRADVRFIDWVAYEDLPSRIAAADIVLGIFGSSQKAAMVIPNKVYEAAAVGAAIVTADTEAIREVFEGGREVVLCRADGLALADAIESLAEPVRGEALREELAKASRARMLQSFSTEALARSWSVALAGPDAPAGSAHHESLPRVGVAVLSFQDSVRTLECLHSIGGDGYPDLDVLVIDNGSVESERFALAEGIHGRIDAEVLRLERNIGFAAGCNLALDKLFARGCDHVLLLNSDARLAAGCIEALVRGSRARPGVGPVGPRVADGRPGQKPLSLGERYWAWALWAPRSLLRVRAVHQRPYRAGGITGCAILVSRALYQRIGGFDESLFAYYEEVDFCLRAREAGLWPLVVPEAQAGHRGARGFASGMTPLAAWLKARNLWLVGMRHARQDVSRDVFGAGYHCLVLASALGYLLRGRSDVARAMIAGMRAGKRRYVGFPPAPLFAASGYPASGLPADADGSGARSATGASIGAAAVRKNRGTGEAAR
ncbi:MAG TPA: glycosyltransferase [Candidatus Binatia bacterium]|jgi:GT2 family glycosyltransferase/glycosyltransferase involved in cell wall biosynthesis